MQGAACHPVSFCMHAALLPSSPHEAQGIPPSPSVTIQWGWHLISHLIAPSLDTASCGETCPDEDLLRSLKNLINCFQSGLDLVHRLTVLPSFVQNQFVLNAFFFSFWEAVEMGKQCKLLFLEQIHPIFSL